MMQSESSTGNERGASLVEFCIILPILAAMIFAIIDIGRLVRARLIVTNVSREGANLSSRDLKSGADLLTLLTSSSSPIDLVNSGKIYVSTIMAGTSAASPDPTISSQISTGNLAVSSGINAGGADLGLTGTMYNHLVYNPENRVADILGITVVEVFYQYTPITPLPNLVPGVLNNGATSIIGSKATFCISGGE